MSSKKQLTSEEKREAGYQWVPLNCDCGSKGGQYLGHWQICRCSCGRYFWALQPLKRGPLVAKFWPGDFRTGALNNGMPRC
jgi:hypothetical protein